MKKPIISIGVIIAFITPYVAVVSGLLVTWLFVHFHWLGVFHIDQNAAARTVAGCVLFAVTAGLTYAAAHWHWLPVVLTKLAVREAAKNTAAEQAPGKPKNL